MGQLGYNLVKEPSRRKKSQVPEVANLEMQKRATQSIPQTALFYKRIARFHMMG